MGSMAIRKRVDYMTITQWVKNSNSSRDVGKPKVISKAKVLQTEAPESYHLGFFHSFSTLSVESTLSEGLSISL